MPSNDDIPDPISHADPNAWDIVGGPGTKPERPNEADYQPGGKWYGLVAYSQAMEHYRAAVDASNHGYWYHANAHNWTQDQYQFNQTYAKSGDMSTNHGVPLVNPSKVTTPTDWHYEFTGGEWHQVSTGSGGIGNGAGGGGGGGNGGSGGGNQSGGLNADSSGLSGAQKGAFDSMALLLQQYGLGSLADTLKGLILDGVTDQASIQLSLQNTDAWKKRFAGNEILKQKGLSVLSVSEYLATEKSYQQVLKNYGLPKGFYDDSSDFASFIGNNVSANELQQRAQIYSDIAKRNDPAVVEQLKSMGLSEGDILAHTMDATRAMPLIQRKYQQTLIGAAARRDGLSTDNPYAAHLADIGVTEQQAIQGYGTISENMGAMTTLAGVYGSDYSQHDFETEVFEQNGAAANKRKRLASQERANFSGSSGVGQGSLVRKTGGSY